MLTNDWLTMRAEALILHERLTQHPTADVSEANALIDRANELQALGVEAMQAFRFTARDRKRMS